MINHIIFDFDGTLVDSSEDFAIETNRLFFDFGGPRCEKVEILSHVSTDFPKFVMDTILNGKAASTAVVEEINERLEAIFRLDHLNSLSIYENVFDFLSKSEASLSIVTNKYEVLTKKIVLETLLAGIPWNSIIGRDTFGVAKPHPRPLLESLRVANINPNNALMVGDGAFDILAARSAGIRSVAVSYGFTPREDLLACHPDFIVDSFFELEELVDRLSA